MQNDKWRPGNNNQGRKSRTKVCEACSLLKGTDDARGGDSPTYCGKYKQSTASKKSKAWRVLLSEKKRHSNDTLALAPSSGKKRAIRARASASHRANEIADGRKGAQVGEESSDESSERSSR
ncbi:hypothetical protein GQ600_22797 [Phytophthora cactorum]|nr:hypothetical protein GQ600_22797 [Phytophthora cactorum]